MKNDKDINNSLSNIKKALREERNISENNKDDNDFFLLEDVVEKKVLEITNNKGIGVVYDGVGKKTFEKSINCLKIQMLYLKKQLIFFNLGNY